MDAAVLRWLTVGHSNLIGFAVAAVCLAVGFAVFLGAWPRLFLTLAMLTPWRDGWCSRTSPASIPGRPRRPRRCPPIRVAHAIRPGYNLSSLSH